MQIFTDINPWHLRSNSIPAHCTKSTLLCLHGPSQALHCTFAEEITRVHTDDTDQELTWNVTSSAGDRLLKLINLDWDSDFMKMQSI